MNEALRNIQNELNAPKNQWNDFGKYHYRNCEGILEAVKPLLKKYGAEVVITDDIRECGGNVYVKATAIFTCGDDEVIVSGYARESESKKGMDASQLTGTASSYARKYALNGLFLIDDSKDADTNEFHNEVEVKTNPKVDAKNVELLTSLANEKGVAIIDICDRFGVGSLQDMTKTDFVRATKMLEATHKKGA